MKPRRAEWHAPQRTAAREDKIRFPWRRASWHSRWCRPDSPHVPNVAAGPARLRRRACAHGEGAGVVSTVQEARGHAGVLSARARRGERVARSRTRQPRVAGTARHPDDLPPHRAWSRHARDRRVSADGTAQGSWWSRPRCAVETRANQQPLIKPYVRVSACPVRCGGGRRRSDGMASEAPSTERDGNRWAILNTTAPTLDPTSVRP
jgi:hypothetical protein